HPHDVPADHPAARRARRHSRPSRRPRLQAFALRDMRLEAATAAEGSRAARIHVDPLIHCPFLRDPLVDDVYALLLTSARPEAGPAVPPLLPEGLVLHLLNELEAALLDLPGLTGHERLGIGA